MPSVTIKQLIANPVVNHLDNVLLLAKVLQKSRSYCYANPAQSITRNQYYLWQNLVRRRCLGEPIAYLLGEKEFWSLSLVISSAVLIPRAETELLVENTLQLLPSTERQVLELGTGSGAISVALGYHRPLWQILAIDQSFDALAIAQRNCERFQLSNIFLKKSDWFGAVGERKFHVIISNPPYIAPKDHHLKQLLFEPSMALTSSQQGLADLQIIIQQAPNYLLSGGWLLLEHGHDQAEIIQGLLQDRGYSFIGTKQDLAGLDRITISQWQ